MTDFGPAGSHIDLTNDQDKPINAMKSLGAIVCMIGRGC